MVVITTPTSKMSSSCSKRPVPTDFPPPRVYRPTLEEFQDFPSYVRQMEEDGCHLTGICKVVVPDEWVARRRGYDVDSFDFRIERPVAQKMVPLGDVKGVYQAKSSVYGEGGTSLSIREYRDLAESRQYRTPEHEDDDDLERKYWKHIRFVPPVYGADVTQSITDPDSRGFNAGNLDSILRHIKEDTGKTYYGVNSPYLYYGMWRATFCWHVEDMDFHAINFIHHGAPKTWYCVPPKYGHLIERAAQDLFPNVAPLCTGFLRHKIALISPEVLAGYGVPVVKMVHRAREIIVVFPYAYHCGFNHGFNIAESTNFANERWIEYGKRHRPCDCMTKTVKVDMTGFVRRYQPELLGRWLKGLDIAPHPEDPEEVRAEILTRAKTPREYARRLEEKHGKRKDPALTYETRSGRTLMCDPVAKDILCRTGDWDEEEERRYEEWKARLEEYVCTDVYRHIELSHVEVKVNPVTMTCLDYNGFAFLKARLGKPHIPSFQDLVDCGEMFRVNRLMMHKSEIREKEVKKEAVDPVKEALKKEVAATEDEGGSLYVNIKVEEGCDTTTADEEEEYDVGSEDSYYSSSDQSDEDSSESSADGGSANDSEYDDPDYGKPQKKRRKLSKKARRKARERRERTASRGGGSTLNNFSADVAKLVETMARLGKGGGEKADAAFGDGDAVMSVKVEGRDAATSDNKENVPNDQPEENGGLPAADHLAATAADTKPGDAEATAQSMEEERVQKEPPPPPPVAAVAVVAEDGGGRGDGGQLHFDPARLATQGKLPATLTRDNLRAVRAIFLGLGIIEEQDVGGPAVWRGADSDRLGESLVDVLGGTREVSEPDEEDEDRAWWPLARDVINIFMETEGKKRVSLYKILEVLYFPDRLERAAEDCERIRMIVNVLVGLSLAEQVRRGRWKYRGPRIYSSYVRRLFLLHREEHPGLQLPSLVLQKVAVPPGAMPHLGKGRRRLFDVGRSATVSVKQRYIEQMTRDVDVSTLDESQRRSLANHKRVCRCGTKVEHSSGKTVHSGFKKRSRCRKCDGCRASKCGACANCLNPRNKQCCERKICLFPVVPKCPCFD